MLLRELLLEEAHLVHKECHMIHVQLLVLGVDGLHWLIAPSGELSVPNTQELGPELLLEAVDSDLLALTVAEVLVCLLSILELLLQDRILLVPQNIGV